VRFAVPTPPEKVPVDPLKETPVVASGLISSINHPDVPFSSPKMMVPHAVRRTGSQEFVPVTIVSTAPSTSRIRTKPGLGCALLVAGNQVSRESIVGPQGHHVDVGWGIRARTHDADLEAFRQCHQFRGIDVGQYASNALTRRFPDGFDDAKQLHRMRVQLIVSKESKIESANGGGARSESHDSHGDQPLPHVHLCLLDLPLAGASIRAPGPSRSPAHIDWRR
jgi:hypothetical protein